MAHIRAIRTLLVIASKISLTGCGGAPQESKVTPLPPTATSGAVQSNPKTQFDIAKHKGPIVAHCASKSNTTILGALDITSGQLTDFATFPTSCYLMEQSSRLLFNVNYTQVALRPTNTSDRHVRYHDLATSETVDVSEIASPSPTGDFGNREEPSHRSPQFDEQGLFVFFDDRADEFKFFDTSLRTVVKTSKAYAPNLYRTLSKDPSALARDGRTQSDNARLCDTPRVIDADRYLRTTAENNSHFLEVASATAINPLARNCQTSHGTRITPASTEIVSAAADPTGSTIVFETISATSRSAHNLYRANMQNPSSPEKIPVSGNILERAGYDGGQQFYIIDWR